MLQLCTFDSDDTFHDDDELASDGGDTSHDNDGDGGDGEDDDGLDLALWMTGSAL